MFVKNPEYFMAIVKERSISKAAERLYLSQPYLSQYLAKLESNLGAVLLDRSHSPLKLTPAGEVFHAYLERQSYLDRQLVSDLRDLQNEKRPVLHIGVSPWRGSTLLPDVLPLFTKQYSDVQVVLHEAPVPELGDLAAGSVTDFCIMHIPGDLTELTYELVMREHIFLFGPPGPPPGPRAHQYLRRPHTLPRPAAAGAGAYRDAAPGLAAVQAAPQYLLRP